MLKLDETHDPARRSWVPGADGHAEFPIQNLPLGIFSPPGGNPRGGVAIGDWIFDLAALHGSGLLAGPAADAAKAASGPTLNPLLALGTGPRRALRQRLSALLASGSEARGRIEPLLHAASGCTLHLPATIGDYTDFYAGIHHARNVGRQFRPDNPLLPNYKYVPIAYHGRASSIRPSGADVRRPQGQIKLPDSEIPFFGPARRLDYELELGIWIAAGNPLGQPIPIGEAEDHVAGLCLLNDWSARDIQAWEYQPLGPFLAKNFTTTISPWIVTAEALAPFRVPQPARPAGDPAPLAYLDEGAAAGNSAYAISLEVLIATAAMRHAKMAPHRLSRTDSKNLYWSIAQLVTHHTASGCNLQPGDLFGSGTISSPGVDAFGSLIELTRGGAEPVALPGGETRTFLQDGDQVILSARAEAPGRVSIGFGACSGVVSPAR